MALVRQLFLVIFLLCTLLSVSALVNRTSLTQSNTHNKNHVCSSRNHNRGILLSFGRSGTDAIMDITLKLSKSPLQAGHLEILGGNTKDMTKLRDPIDVVEKYFLKFKTTKDLILFKWKPHEYFVPEDERLQYNELWDYVATNCIAVVYSYRNPIDMIISKTKHEETNVRAHCRVTDLKCIEKHRHVSLSLQTELLVAKIARHERIHKEILEDLKHYKVYYFQTTYEELFFEADRTKNWEHLMRFIDMQFPTKRVLTENDIKSSDAVTFSNRSFTVKNYDDVVTALTEKHPEYTKYLKEAAAVRYDE